MNNQRDIYNIEGNDFNMSNPNEEKEIDKDKDQRKIIERVMEYMLLLFMC